MTRSMALNIGEAFADIVVSLGDKKIQKRWFLPGLQAPKAIADWISSERLLPIANVRLCTSWAENIFRRQLGSPASIVVTSGFEGWLELASTTRPLLRTDADHILGIHERTLSDGSIRTPLADEDLVFLAEKLKLMKIQVVGLSFLHSHKNPTNEKKAAHFLREHGFRVVASHETKLANAHEIDRWNHTINRVYTEDPFRGWLEPWLKALGDLEIKPEQIWILGGDGFVASPDLKDACNTSSGPALALERCGRVQGWSQPFTYFGFEQFIDQKLGLLELQPLQILERGHFGVVSLSRRNILYDIGPMFWGRGVQATVLDTVVEACHPQLPPELQLRWNDRGAKRFHETLLALSRSIVTEQRMTYEALLEVISNECREPLSPLKDRCLVGPLAHVFEDWMPAGKKRVSQLGGFEIAHGLLAEL
jgi:hypothetical protein